MDIEGATPTEEAIFEALATYRYVTPAQLLALGVTKDKSHLYETLRNLKRRKPVTIVERNFGSLPGHGRLSSIYVLTQNGAELLLEQRRDLDDVKVIKRPRLFNSDYFHRVGCVDFHITVARWTEQTGARIDFFDTYYDPMPGGSRGGRPKQKTQIVIKGGTLIPDAMFAFTDQAGSKRLFAFEFYCGRRTGRVIDQLATYLRALDQEAIEKTYAYENVVRVLVVFDDKEGMRLVGERMTQLGNFKGHRDDLYLKTLDQVQHDFKEGWQRFDGEMVSLF